MYKRDTSGSIIHYAGDLVGTPGYSGDGGVATSALFSEMWGIARDKLNSLYVTDADNYVIRKIDPSGTVTTVAGNNFPSYTGDNDSLSHATMYPESIASDSSGNIYISDTFNKCIRKITTSGIISRVAGRNSYLGYDYTSDGYPAKLYNLDNHPFMTVDKAGNIYFSDHNDNKIHKVTLDGILHTIAGNGWTGYVGDGGAATNARLNYPSGIVVDKAGNVYFADASNHVVRQIDTAGIIHTIAGTGTSGFTGDGGPATAAKLNLPGELGIDKAGNIYVADYFNYRIRKINTAGIISTVIGTGVFGYSGDGGPAIAAQIGGVHGIAVDRTGNLYFSDIDTNVVRKVDTFGIISTIAGNSFAGFSGDGGPAVTAQLNGPRGVLVDKNGNVLIADNVNGRISFVCASDSIFTADTISITSPAGNTICAGDYVTFTATATYGYLPTYQWKLNSTAIPGATNNFYATASLASGDIISCEIAPNPAPCAASGTALSNSITMTVNPVFPPPSSVAVTASPGSVDYPGETITYTATYVNGGTTPSFQWYVNGVLVPGATTNPFVTSAVSNGDVVSVTVFTSNTCAIPDSATGAFTTGIPQLTGNTNNIDMYPNPNNGSFTIKGRFNGSNHVMITITNLMGTSVYSENKIAAGGYLNKEIVLSNQLKPGVYFLRINSNGYVDNYPLLIRK